MKSTYVLRIENVLIWDLAALGLMYLLPTMTHFLSFPLYRLEPMRCVLLINLLILGNQKNAYFMAVTLPLFSFVVASHPVLLKSIVMVVELTVNIFVFEYLSKRKTNNVITMFLSIVISKVVYYSLKIWCIGAGILDANIIDTNLVTQLLVAIMLSLGFAFFCEKKVQKN